MNECANDLRQTDNQTCRSGGLLRVPAEAQYLALIGVVVRWFGGRAGLSDEKCSDLEVAVDEACTNIICHAFPQGAKGDLTVACSPINAGLKVTISDNGGPFDPQAGSALAGEKQSRDPASGGMGLVLIHQLADAVHYERDERSGNRLTLIKNR